jgi:hypothetical protein
VSESGSNSADSAANSNPSSNGGKFNSANDARTLTGFSDVSIDDMIGMHLVDCSQCRDAIRRGPVAIGQKSGHCDAYWQLQLMRAKYEGSVNNIVAYTEHGDEAQKGRPLE